uniref:Cyclin N-terminal domain-containing protein n=1 Tax=Oryza meridionalis TaxID=40149 RepID=A0A0E0CXN5_9ORYZ
MLPKRRKTLFLVRPRLLWQRHLHAGVAGGAFAATLLFLVLVLLSTSAPSSSPPSLRDSSVVSSGRRSSSSSPPPFVNCDDMTASLGEFGDMMVSMLPKNLAFTVFVPSPESFRRVLKLRRPNDSAVDGNVADDDATYAVVSRVLGFSAVPRRLRAADVVPPRRRQQVVAVAPVLESVSGLRISAWRRDVDGALVVNGVPSECVDIVKERDIIVHVMAGVLMDAEFERIRVNSEGLVEQPLLRSPHLFGNLVGVPTPRCRGAARATMDEDRAVEAAASAWPGPSRRRRLIEFLLHASTRLDLRPVVKYTALSFFADRLLPSLPRKMGFCGARGGRAVTSWLLEPLRDSNLELFALVAVWIASKIHELKPLSVKSLKALGDRIIADQHFTCRDFANAELVFMEVVEYNIGSLNIAFTYLEELLVQFREISKIGDLLNMDVCMEILDILYETEDSSWLFNSPCQLAASALVTAYAISVPKQRWEFPILPWVKFTTSYDEEEIMKVALTILMHLCRWYLEITNGRLLMSIASRDR